MARSVEQQVAELTDVVLRQRATMTLMDIAIRSLLLTHPHPERLRAAFEPSGTRLLDRAVNSPYPDDTLEAVRSLFQGYLALIDKAPGDPAAALS
jgi:hypothetical protein